DAVERVKAVGGRAPGPERDVAAVVDRRAREAVRIEIVAGAVGDLRKGVRGRLSGRRRQERQGDSRQQNEYSADGAPPVKCAASRAGSVCQERPPSKHLDSGISRVPDERVTESHPRCSTAMTFLGTRPPPARIWRLPAPAARHPEPRRESARAAARAVT